MPVASWVAPYGGASPADILRNLAAVRKNRAGKNRPAIFHITGDIHYLSLALPSRRTVLTIHDCVFMYRTTGIRRSILKRLFLDWPVRHCRLVTTISETTRQDILRFTGCPSEKVRVIPNPVDESIRFEPRPFHTEEPVILFIGSTANKNLDRVIEALEEVPCHLNIVGKITEAQEADLQKRNIRFSCRSGLTDEEIAGQYRQSDIVLFPSTFEGFGLPIIEGQQAGRPVITSNLSPMREVAGGAACLVDPLEPASIREGVLAVIGNPQYREDLVKRGFRNIRQYEPSVIAGEYLAVYRMLLAE
jgi:glycosyltransferase involved in cell wall biosynthesis